MHGLRGMQAVVGSVVMALSVGCGTPTAERDGFEPGDSNDPIVRAEQALAAASVDTLSVAIRNGSGYDLTEGLIVLSSPFTVNAAPSAAMIQFVDQSSSKRGNATEFAKALGLTIGTNAFVVPALGKNKSTTVTIQVPSTATMSYVARVNASIDDFVAAVNVALVSGAPGPASGVMNGYDLRNAQGKTTINNGTTGSNLGSGTTFVMTNLSDCPGGASSGEVTLVKDGFSAGANDKAWPAGYGWDGEFGGDWFTDGVTVRVFNPRWGGGDPNAPIPAITGFWKTVDVCPSAKSLLQVEASVVTQFDDPTSDSTLVVYFFGRNGGLISVTTNHPIYDLNTRSFSIVDAVIPDATRRIAVAPMMRLGAEEDGTMFIDTFSATTEPASLYTTTSLATDAFATFTSGTRNPSGWSEFGGDWYGLTPQNWATLGNPAWSGGMGSAGVDTGMTKEFNLTGTGTGSLLNARLFVAATFTDPTSFVRLRVILNTGETFESQRQTRGYGWLDIRRQAIPTNANKATVIINTYLGPKETSSLYVDDFSLARTKKN